MEPIAMVMRRTEWFGHVKRRDETENIRAVVEMKMEQKYSRGRPKLRWKETVRKEKGEETWKSKEEWATDREKWKGVMQTPLPHTGTQQRKVIGEKRIYVTNLPL